MSFLGWRSHREKLTQQVYEEAVRERAEYLALEATNANPRRPRANPWLIYIEDRGLDAARRAGLGPYPRARR